MKILCFKWLRGSFLKILTIFSAFSVLTGGVLHAVLINFDAGPGDLQAGQAVLGFSSVDVWNGIDNAASADGNSYAGLVDSNNNPLQGVTFTRTGTPYDGSGSISDPPSLPMDPATTPLMEDFLWTWNDEAGYGNPIVWTLSGLSAYAGDAFTYVIYSAGGHGANSRITLADSNGGGSAFTAATSRRISDGPGVAYVEFLGTVDASGQVQFSQSSYNYNNDPDFIYNNAPFNGAQIQITTGSVPEPSSTGLLIGGIFLAEFLHRRRR